MHALSRTKFLVLAAVAGMAVTLGNEPTAQAGTTTDTLVVNATVLAACQTSTTTLNIGTYNAMTTNATADLVSAIPGGVAVNCASGVTFGIALDAGQNAASATVASRAMASVTTGEFLDYDLYDGDPAGTGVLWADTANNAFTTSTSQAIWGVAPQGQTPSAGTDYTDSVNVTVDFN
jgi:hypothetical protein